MIAVIAGTGVLPVEAIKSIKRKNLPFCVVSLFPDDNIQALTHVAQGYGDCLVEHFYKPSTIIASLKERGVTDIVMVGKVDKKLLFQRITFDLMSMKLLASLMTKGDRAIMEVVTMQIEQHGFRVIAQDVILGGLLVKPGIVTGMSDTQLDEDIRLGIQLAQQMSALDIGQTVVVKDGVVLAVEALEGTDSCLQRGMVLGKGGVVLCKAVSYDQNKKYDLPTLGPRSLQGLVRGQVRAIAWLAAYTLIAEKENFIHQAQELDITLIAVGN